MKRAVMVLAISLLTIGSLACQGSTTDWPEKPVVEHPTEDCRFHVKTLAEDGSLLGVKAIDAEGDIWSVKACIDEGSNDAYLQVTQEE